MVLFIVLHKVLFGVTVLSVWLKQSGSVHILCNMVLFIVLHKVLTVWCDTSVCMVETERECSYLVQYGAVHCVTYGADCLV